MNCQELESIIIDLAREQIMEANMLEQVAAHSRKCEACSLRLQDERALTLGLRALAAEMRSEEASLKVEEQLRAVFRSKIFAESRPVAARPWGYWVTAAAAVILVMFGITEVRLRLAIPSKQGPQPRETASAETFSERSSTVAESLTSSSLLQPTNALVSHGRRPTAKLHRRAIHASDGVDGHAFAGSGRATTVTGSYNGDEVATDFMPLAYGSPLNLQDGGQIVRVELPRSTMASFGLPVNMDRYRQKVKADVLFGADGLARAIRFVQ